MTSEYEDRNHFGIISKIMLCERDARVFNRNMCPKHAKDDYRDLMNSGTWPERHGTGEDWEWGTPSDYMKGGRTKLLLYDRYEGAITVQANVFPGRMWIEECDCDPNTKTHFHYRNIMDPKTVQVLENPIPRATIRLLEGFSNFNGRGDRTTRRLISRKDYDMLFPDRRL